MSYQEYGNSFELSGSNFMWKIQKMNKKTAETEIWSDKRLENQNVKSDEQKKRMRFKMNVATCSRP